MTAPRQLADLNALVPADFVAALAPVWENASWVTEAVALGRPFPSAGDLHAAMLAQVTALPPEELRAFLNRHPDLGGADLRAGRVTADSQAEQQAIRLHSLDATEAAEWDELNAAYKARFGFPFILCVRRHDRASALAALRARLERSTPAELAAAIEEIAWITRYRLAARIADHGLTGL